MVTCKEFAPSELTITACRTCGHSWGSHSQLARSAFFLCATPTTAEALVRAVNGGERCGTYTPARTWAVGKEPAPECANCGRSAKFFHMPTQVLAGIKNFRAKEREQSMTIRTVCGHFHHTLARPNVCTVCDYKWIDHAPSARTLVIEAFTTQHKDWCKCVTMAGDVMCSCMTDAEKQQQLDIIAGDKPASNTVSCRRFQSKAPGVTNCLHCGENFYRHTRAACDNHDLFMTWRTFNMSDAELLDWFMSLGTTREARIKVCEKLLLDPTFRVTPAPNKIAPHQTLIGAIYEAISGSRYILPPAAANSGKGTAVLDAVRVDVEQPVCYSCRENSVSEDGKVCADCATMFTREGTPAPDAETEAS